MREMLGRAKRTIEEILQHDYEKEQLIRFLQDAGLEADSHILDVGCGYGRNMDAIRECLGWEIEGVEINPHIVEENRKRGLHCRTADEFFSTMGRDDLDAKYDCMIFSHIIEHFFPKDLKTFLDEYLKESLINRG